MSLRRVLHWGIIASLVGETMYCTFQVFVVMQPEGSAGPLWFGAADMDPDLLVPRRLYAIEGWIAFIGLSLYLAVSGVLPGQTSQVGSGQG